MKELSPTNEIASSLLHHLLFPVIYPDKVEGISGLIEQTKNMFDYHSKLQSNFYKVGQHDTNLQKLSHL